MYSFDVLLPVYAKDEPNMLNNALQSIVRNSYQPSKILVAIDGPIDNELKQVIYTYKDKHSNIHIKTSNINLGLSKNLNDSIPFCKSDIIIRCDADDVNLEFRFESLITHLAENPQVGVVSSSIREIDNDGRSKIKHLPTTHSLIKKYALWRNPVNHMAVAYRKDIFVSNKYPNVQYKEDYALWLSLIRQGYIFANLPEVLVDVSAGPQQLRRRSGLANIRSELQLLGIKSDVYGFFWALTSTVIRIFTLILPARILRFIYIKLRNK